MWVTLNSNNICQSCITVIHICMQTLEMMSTWHCTDKKRHLTHKHFILLWIISASSHCEYCTVEPKHNQVRYIDPIKVTCFRIHVWCFPLFKLNFVLENNYNVQCILLQLLHTYKLFIVMLWVWTKLFQMWKRCITLTDYPYDNRDKVSLIFNPLLLKLPHP